MHTSSQAFLAPPKAAVDTTTGYGADSFFDHEHPQDPWADRCLANIVDVTVNHRTVVHPLSSGSLRDGMALPLLPATFRGLYERAWLEVPEMRAVDEVQLTSEILAAEYDEFVAFVTGNLAGYIGLSEYQRGDRLREVYDALVPTSSVDTFWAARRDSSLSEVTGVSDARLRRGFDAFTRGAQYHELLGGSVPYFPHPFRSKALGFLPVVALHEGFWSWGRYFVQLMKERGQPRDIGQLLDLVGPLRDLTLRYGARWYDLHDRSVQEQQDLLAQIASESGLPARITDDARRAISATMAVGGVVAGPLIPLVGVVFGLGAAAVQFWRGGVPGNVGKVSVFRGWLTWPGLIDEAA